MIRKVLIANRGEIALRIIRACRELAIQTTAVYSQPDEQSLHVHLADEAICIGPGPSSESYLRADRIISAAEIANVDAIHPGYGFLSENADFAEKCESCNIRFIGPTAATIRKMGDKALARETMKKAQVPIVPGSEGPVQDEAKAMATAKKIGFPVIIKAVSGGGGRGLRIAHNAVAFAKELETASLEAEKAFGDGSLYIEKYLESPRHIEFQILADSYGKIVHLGERDCSVQRRHQKVIEEAPSPFLDAKMRKRMGETAIKAAAAAEYVNAGTVEFLVDQNGDFYFMEMNTRIQVEHPVTEEVTGIDLVKEQIEIANGKRLLYDQKKIVMERHAVECRICAEDPSNDFAPSPGKISLYYPPGGHGVRVDSHIYGDYVISPYYDSMIGKVIAHGRTRKIALDRMYRALSEYLIRGVKTNLGFAKAIIADPAFRQGDITTSYVEEFLKRTPKNLFSKDIHSKT
ncbi:MAG: acetyl-CoA carboxylase biotin carboxylase subunit [Opitutales bacterium]|nr:acetyl-CoA carboxylase biotin carboxylase subunit [Opitutales bacterium]